MNYLLKTLEIQSSDVYYIIKVTKYDFSKISDNKDFYLSIFSRKYGKNIRIVDEEGVLLDNNLLMLIPNNPDWLLSNQWVPDVI